MAWHLRQPLCRLALRAVAFAAALSIAAGAGAADPPSLASLVEKLLESEPGRDRRQAVERILRGGWSFDEVHRELRDGRRYAPAVKLGIVERSRRNRDGTLHRYLLAVPKSYSPSRPYPVRVHLHGGVARPAWEGKAGWVRDPERFLKEERIAVIPAGWAESRWWQASQVENVTEILREVKRTFNVDEDRISVAGTSDGGTGAWYFAFRCPTPFASYVPLIGSPNVLANPDSGTEGSIFLVNVVGKSFFVVNGTTDHLYPAEGLRPMMDAFRKAGADVTYEVENGGHDTSWYPRRERQIEAFVEAHPRDPLPDHVLWATERAGRSSRFSWVVIDALSDVPPRLSVLGRPPSRTGGLDVTRDGNSVEVVAIGVRRYRLLVSPDEFDLGSEIVVRTNGHESFRGRVARRLETLLEWAAEDVDRRLLFAAQIEVDVSPGSDEALAGAHGG